MYDVQRESRQLLPNLDLRAGEVRRLGSYPVGGSPAFDIWEGMYLDREKCAIKVIRGINNSPNAQRVSEHFFMIMVWYIDRRYSDSNGKSRFGGPSGNKTKEPISCPSGEFVRPMDLTRKFQSFLPLSITQVLRNTADIWSARG